jgi:pantothenate kinase type III
MTGAREVVEVRYYTSLDPVADRGERQKQFWGALDAHDARLTRLEVDPYDPVQQLGTDLVANAAAVGLAEVALVVSAGTSRAL